MKPLSHMKGQHFPLVFIKKRQHFPLEFAKIMVLRQTNITHLSKAMERKGYKLSKQFLSQISTGSRAVPQLQLERICETLQCNEDERRVLNLAACRDNGFYV